MRDAFMVGLVLAAVWFVEKCLTTPMVFRPIVVGPLVGLVLGDVKMGILCAATLETVFMGAIQVGSAVPPDPMIGAGVGTALAILSGGGPIVAFTLGFPIAIFGQSIKVVCFIIRSWYMGSACKYARNVELGKMQLLNWAGLFLQCAIYGLVGFSTVYFGASAVEGFINSIPASIMNGLNVAGGLLPAVGFALLVQPMMNKNNIIYFILGFICVAFLKLPAIGVTAFGIVLAYIIVFEKTGGNGGSGTVEAVSEKEHDDWEELFDE